jgi:hypothetical protein
MNDWKTQANRWRVCAGASLACLLLLMAVLALWGIEKEQAVAGVFIILFFVFATMLFGALDWVTRYTGKRIDELGQRIESIKQLGQPR